MINGNYFNLTDIANPSKRINVKVVSPDGGKIEFTLMENQPLHNLMNTYSRRQCVNSRQLKYTFKNNDISGYHTPLELNMKNNSIIKATLTM